MAWPSEDFCDRSDELHERRMERSWHPTVGGTYRLKCNHAQLTVLRIDGFRAVCEGMCYTAERSVLIDCLELIPLYLVKDKEET
jgi:hypothetical protein